MNGRRSVAVGVLGIMLSCLVAAVASAQTVDELVAKNIQAKGGIDRLRAIKSVRQTSNVNMQGTTASVVVYAKRPNWMRQEITIGGQTVINGFDGVSPWMANPTAGTAAPMVVTGPQAEAIREQSDFDGPLVDYRAKGFRIELAGQETIDGRPVQHLRVIDKNQRVQHCYLDVTTGLEVRLVSSTETGSIEQDLSDYRQVDGVTIPFAIRTRAGGAVQAQLAVSKVEFNLPVDDNFFKMAR